MKRKREEEKAGGEEIFKVSKKTLRSPSEKTGGKGGELGGMKDRERKWRR